jgi:hypothetical protein
MVSQCAGILRPRSSACVASLACFRRLLPSIAQRQPSIDYSNVVHHELCTYIRDYVMGASCSAIPAPAIAAQEAEEAAPGMVHERASERHTQERSSLIEGYKCTE